MRTKPFTGEYHEGLPESERLDRSFGVHFRRTDADAILALAASTGQSISTTIRELVAIGLAEIEK